MTPTDSRSAQIEKYRGMSGHERLFVGLRLHELSCEISRNGIRAMKPDATEDEIEQALRQRLNLTHEIGERAVTG